MEMDEADRISMPGVQKIGDPGRAKAKSLSRALFRSLDLWTL